MANAGQNPPLVRRASGEIEVLTKTGSELNVFDELEISNKTITLASLDEVVLYTDGVTEAYHPQRNEEYGIDRLYVYQSLKRYSIVCADCWIGTINFVLLVIYLLESHMTVNLTPIIELRKSGQHEEAKAQLVKLAAQFPANSIVQYETACVHDFLGFEREAVPFYLAAIQNGLSGNNLRSAYLGLGSTYRTLGMYKESKETLLEGLKHFPEAAEMKVFLAMTQYNLSEHHAAIASLLNIIVDKTSDSEIKGYARAIREYSENLDRVWD